MKIARLVALSAFLSAAVAFACGDDESDIPAECEEIAATCHDSTSDLGQDCHENAEGTWSAQQCLDNETECLAECEE